MKRHTEFLVRKRNGRLEWLRATKLARSIRHAFGDEEVVAEDAILCLTETILTALMSPPEPSVAGGDPADAPIPSAALAEAVEHSLRSLGRADAAERYASERRSRRTRRALLDTQCEALSNSLAEQSESWNGSVGPVIPQPDGRMPDLRTGALPPVSETASLDNATTPSETSPMPDPLARNTPKTRSSR